MGWWIFWTILFLVFVGVVYVAVRPLGVGKHRRRNAKTGVEYDELIGPGPLYGGWSSSPFGTDAARVVRHRGRGPRGYRRSDTRIQEEINDRLTYGSDFDASDVEVDVRNGEVTLRGSVNTRADRRDIEALVDEVTGVMDIKNELHVRKPAEERPGAA